LRAQAGFGTPGGITAFFLSLESACIRFDLRPT
jgi:hypothetical protein